MGEVGGEGQESWCPRSLYQLALPQYQACDPPPFLGRVFQCLFHRRKLRFRKPDFLGSPPVLHQAASGMHSQTLLHEYLGHSLCAHRFSSDKLSSPHPARLSSSPAPSVGLTCACWGSLPAPTVLAWAAIHSLRHCGIDTLQAVSSHSQTWLAPASTLQTSPATGLVIWPW